MQTVLMFGDSMKRQHFAWVKWKGSEVLETHHIFFYLLEECNTALRLYSVSVFCGGLNKISNDSLSFNSSQFSSLTGSSARLCWEQVFGVSFIHWSCSSIRETFIYVRGQNADSSILPTLFDNVIYICTLHISHKIDHQFKEGKISKVLKSRGFDNSKVFICMFAVLEMNIYIVLFWIICFQTFLKDWY